MCVHTTTVRSDWSSWFQRSSKAGRLFHSLAYVFRFIKNVRCTPENHKFSALTAEEITFGRTWLFKLVQRDVFYREISALEKGTTFPRSRVKPYTSANAVFISERLAQSRWAILKI